MKGGSLLQERLQCSTGACRCEQRFHRASGALNGAVKRSGNEWTCWGWVEGPFLAAWLAVCAVAAPVRQRPAYFGLHRFIQQLHVRSEPIWPLCKLLPARPPCLSRLSKGRTTRTSPPMLPRAVCTTSGSSLRAASSRSRLRVALATPVRRLLGLGSGSSAWAGGSDRLGVAAAQQRRPAASALEALAEADGLAEALQPPPSPRPPLRHPGSHLHLAAQPRPLAVEHPHPGIELFLGPMFAGKTTALLRRVAELEAKGFNVAVVKSSKDDRYCNASVVTHNGLKRVRGAGCRVLWMGALHANVCHAACIQQL